MPLNLRTGLACAGKNVPIARPRCLIDTHSMMPNGRTRTVNALLMHVSYHALRSVQAVFGRVSGQALVTAVAQQAQAWGSQAGANLPNPRCRGTPAPTVISMAYFDSSVT